MLSVAVLAAPQGGGRARTAPGSSFGAGGADRPQPPANALSMVLTARSTARCSGHKLFLGAKKKLPNLDGKARANIQAAAACAPHVCSEVSSQSAQRATCRPPVVAELHRFSG